MPRRELICPQCGTEFHSYKANARFCSRACLRERQETMCEAGHDLTLPGAKRTRGRSKNRCTECEKAAGERWRRRVGKKPRGAFLEAARKTPEEKRETKRLNAERARRRAGARKRTVVDASMRVRRELPTELRRAYGRANFGSQMKRKYPTLDSLKRAYAAGEIKYHEQ